MEVAKMEVAKVEVTKLDPWYTDVSHEADEDEDDNDLSFGPDDPFDLYHGQSLLHHMVNKSSTYSIPPYFKRDHPGDDSFLEELSNFEIPVRRRPNYIMSAVETLAEDVVVELIWFDGQGMRWGWNPKTWNMDKWRIDPASYPLSEEEIENLYTCIIESVVSFIYFIYPQPELFKIGHGRLVNSQLDKLWVKLQTFWKEKKRSYGEVCLFVTDLISKDNNEYNLLTEDDISNIIYHFPYFRHDDSRCQTFSYPSYPFADESDKEDKIFKDIAKVVKDSNPPPPLKADEHTHWMMTFLRGNAYDVELDFIRKIIDGREKLPMPVKFSLGSFHEDFYPLFSEILHNAKQRMNTRLALAVMPLIKIFNPMRRGMSRVLLEIVQVAELRRMALGARFIGRSHLIWAFYKLGYALPLEIRAKIKFDDADEDHPPYHIYMAAVLLTVLSWDKITTLVHFIFAVIHSKDIGVDGQGVIQLCESFKKFKEVLEKTENEIEPKHTVTVRSCRTVDAIIQEMTEKYVTRWNYTPDGISSEELAWRRTSSFL